MCDLPLPYRGEPSEQAILSNPCLTGVNPASKPFFRLASSCCALRNKPFICLVSSCSAVRAPLRCSGSTPGHLHYLGEPSAHHRCSGSTPGHCVGLAWAWGFGWVGLVGVGVWVGAGGLEVWRFGVVVLSARLPPWRPGRSSPECAIYPCLTGANPAHH